MSLLSFGELFEIIIEIIFFVCKNKNNKNNQNNKNENNNIRNNLESNNSL
jgi:hypothetical protein